MTEPAWSRPARDVLEALDATPDGLTGTEAADRLSRHGPNRLPEPPRPGPLRRLARQFNNLLLYVLMAAAAITAALGHWIDTAVIMAVVLANAVIGFVQEGRAEQALAALRQMLAPRATVLRDGARASVDAADLVPGDVVLLEAGDRVPADLRLMRVQSLRIEEAVLTGESVPVNKATDPVAADATVGDRACMAFSGTMVVQGAGRGVVTATGAGTEIGRISGLLGEVQKLTTPLIRQMDDFARKLTGFVLAVSAALLAFMLALGGRSFAEAFMIVVGLLVAAIPEGLPAALTVTLAIGVQAMARRNCIVRRLPAIETLGAVSVICSDKTGTLTRNQMAVTRLATAAGVFDIAGTGYAPEGAITGPDGTPADPAALAPLAEVAALCNTAALHQGETGWQVEGDPMEGALLALAGKLGVDATGRDSLAATIPFDAAYRYMAVLRPGDDGGGGTILVKGAPEAIFDRCAQVARAEGAFDRAAWEAQAEAIADEGMRVLALAVKPHAGQTLAHDDLADLTLLGLAGLIDPPRDEAIAAVADCHRAGITVKMITGDHKGTALAIGRQIGLKSTDRALTGAEIERLDDDALAQAARDTDVFARTSPEHKLRLVTALQSCGAVVAMTGDGVNDAPALKRADAGVAMGLTGSAAAREASELVLTDDNFASIAEAVRRGRTVHDNLRKVITFLLPVNGGESLSLVIAVLFGLMLPITPLQILWVNMVSSVALAMALAFERPEPGVMRRPPRRPDAPILSRFILWRIALVSVLFSIGIFGQFVWATASGASIEHARTLALNTLVAMEVFYLFSVRYRAAMPLSLQAFRGTPAVLVAVAVVLGLQAILTYTPPMQAVFDTVPLSPLDLAGCVLAGLALFAVLEFDKRAAGWWKQKREAAA